MPRFGPIQRQALEELPPVGTAGPWGAGITTGELAARIYGPTPTPGQVRSLQRAVAALEVAGLVVARRSSWWRGGRRLARAGPSTTPPAGVG